MNTLPQFENYMDTSSKNYGLNSLRFWDGEGNVFWFSYQTLVAFKPVGQPIVCHVNDWGPTTGKHLNAIDSDKKTRVNSDNFKRLYQENFGGE